MKITGFLIVAALAGCSRPVADHAEPPAPRDAALEQARSAVAETQTAVLAQRVHALEVEVARMRGAPEVANLQLLDARMKALELKVYASPPPDTPPAPASSPARPAPAGKRTKAAANGRAPVNPFPTYRRPTPAERAAVDRIVG